MNLGPDGLPIAFQDLPPEAFPLTIEARLDDERGKLLWERTVEPYVLTDVPALPEFAGRVHVTIRLATGATYTQPPMSPEAARAHIDQRVEDSKDAG